MGADMMLKDSNGCTPVHHAAIEGHTDCLKLLVTNTTELIGLLHTKNNDVMVNNVMVNDVMVKMAAGTHRWLLPLPSLAYGSFSQETHVHMVV